MLASVTAAHLGSAAVSYVGGTLEEDFTDDNFNAVSTGTSVSWTDDSTVPNWYASGSSWSGNLIYQFGGGTFNTNDLYALKFDADGNSSDPAGSLGARTSGSGQPISYGMAVVNNTGSTLTSFDISYDGFVARGGSVPGTPLDFDFKVGGSFTDSGYAGVASASSTFNVGGSIGNGVGGNPAGDVQSLSGSGIAFTWNDGDTLWLRWTNGTSGNDSLGIDNISFTAVPEPSTYALLFGLLGLGLVIRRRRK